MSVLHAATSTSAAPASHNSDPSAPASTSKPEGEGAEGEEDKEGDAAAVTAVIWKELAELSAVQAKLKVGCHLVSLNHQYMHSCFCCLCDVTKI